MTDATMTCRKKPLWPWIVAVLIGLPMLYILGLGSVMRMTLYFDQNGWPWMFCQIYLYPAMQAAYSSEVLQFILGKYIQLWMPSVMPGPTA